MTKTNMISLLAIGLLTFCLLMAGCAEKVDATTSANAPEKVIPLTPVDDAADATASATDDAAAEGCTDCPGAKGGEKPAGCEGCPGAKDTEATDEATCPGGKSAEECGDCTGDCDGEDCADKSEEGCEDCTDCEGKDGKCDGSECGDKEDCCGKCEKTEETKDIA